MANAKFLSCASATFGTEFFSTVQGSVTADASIVRTTNARSYKLNTGSPVVEPRLQRSSVLADAGRRVSVWVYFPVVPTVSTTILNFGQSLAAVTFSVFFSGAGDKKLRLQAVGGTTVVGTTVLAANTWYRIAVSYTITNSTTFTAKLYLNGGLEITNSNTGTLTNTGTSEFTVRISTATTNFVMYADEMYIDDGSDNADPGGIGVTAKRPASNNVNNFNMAIGANPANRWTNVNERPISETNGWSDTSITSQAENYGLEAASAGDVDISAATVVARTAWAWAKQSVASAGSPQLTDNGTDNAITLTTTSALYTVVTTSSSYPSNAAGIGMKSAGTAVDATNLYECGTIIAYLANASEAAAGAVSASASTVVSAPAEAAAGAVSASASTVVSAPAEAAAGAVSATVSVVVIPPPPPQLKSQIQHLQVVVDPQASALPFIAGPETDPSSGGRGTWPNGDPITWPVGGTGFQPNKNINLGKFKLTITALDQTKAAGTLFTPSSVIADILTADGLEPLDTIVAINFASLGVGPPAPIGNYAIQLSNARIANIAGTDVTFQYKITYKPGRLQVQGKVLTITAKDQSKVQGETFIWTGNEFTAVGLQDGDTINSVHFASAGAAAGAAVGTYPIVPSNASITLGAGHSAYAVIYANGTMTVSTGFNAIVVFTQQAATSPQGAPTVTDNRGNTYNLAGTGIFTKTFDDFSPTKYFRLCFFYALTTSSSPVTVSVVGDPSTLWAAQLLPGIGAVDGTAFNWGVFSGSGTSTDVENTTAVRATGNNYVVIGGTGSPALSQFNGDAFPNPPDVPAVPANGILLFAGANASNGYPSSMYGYYWTGGNVDTSGYIYSPGPLQATDSPESDYWGLLAISFRRA